MSRGYYQLGGFRPQLDWFRYDEKKLAEMIAGDASPLRPRGKDFKQPVGLVLGIKPTGTSHLLLTEFQVDCISRSERQRWPSQRPTPASDFESLSPIFFYNADELWNKLSALKCKSLKGREAFDNSIANKPYSRSDSHSKRGGFEHGRFLFHTLQNNIDVRQYSIDDASWTRSVRVYSFVYNPRPNDMRPSAERLARPVMLDCGLSEATVPDLTLKSESTVHLALANNRFMSSGKKLDFEYGKTDELESSVLAKRLQEFFKERSSQPMILLVHDQVPSMNLLKNYGVDTSAWESGMKALLGFKCKTYHQPSRSGQNDPRLRLNDPRRASYEEYAERRNRPRSRSRSPHRLGNYTSSARPSSSYGDPRRMVAGSSDYLEGSSHPAPVYVVDVKQMYISLMQTEVASENVAIISERLDLSVNSGWCAGNESALIIDLWRSMISGPPIDEQRVLVERSCESHSGTAQPGSSASPAEEENDSDRDPNDIVMLPTPMSMDPDDDSDYGESDSD